MRKNQWNTYATSGFTCDIANDQASAGGVHMHQVRRTYRGWQKRVLQVNGRHQAAGPVSAISTEQGEAHYATAQQQQ